MLRNIISSNLVYHEHRIVKLQYFENIVRYDKFFQQATDLVETAIVSFYLKKFYANFIHLTFVRIILLDQMDYIIMM